MWRRLSFPVGGGRIRVLDSSPSARKQRRQGLETLSMALWWITRRFVWTTPSPLAPTPRPQANTMADPISPLGVQLLGTGSTSTEKGQGRKDLVTGNRDQGGISRGLPRENPAAGRAPVEFQGCAQGPAPVLTPEENLLQDLHHHLLLGKEQGSSGKQIGSWSQAGKGRRLPGGIRSSSSPGLRIVDPGDLFRLHQEGMKVQLHLVQKLETAPSLLRCGGRQHPSEVTQVRSRGHHLHSLLNIPAHQVPWRDHQVHLVPWKGVPVHLIPIRDPPAPLVQSKDPLLLKKSLKVNSSVQSPLLSLPRSPLRRPWPLVET